MILIELFSDITVNDSIFTDIQIAEHHDIDISNNSGMLYMLYSVYRIQP
jgi:hypothetical protein